MEQHVMDVFEPSSSSLNINVTSPLLPEPGVERAVFAFTALTGLATCCGTVGNILVIGAVLVQKQLRDLRNAFIVNLAVADLMICAISNPFSIYGGLNGGDFFYKHPIICEIIGSLCITSCSCSVWSIAAISINRYICICHNKWYYRVYTKRKMPLYITGMWILCFLVDFPCFVGWGDHVFDTRALLCAASYLHSYSYSIYVVALGFWLPMVFVSICYYRIFSFARSSMNNLKKSQETMGDTKIKQDELKLLRSIATIWVTFILMWTPFTIIVFFDRHGTWPPSFYIMAIGFAHTNSSVNWFIYAVTNKTFRQGYLKFITVLFTFHHRDTITTVT